MRIKITKTGEVMTVNDSYGARMIEQGQAVPDAPVKKAAAKKGKEAAEAAAGDA